jgi:hypothetical protein
MPACPAFNSERRRESEKPTGNQREKIDGKERGSLHLHADCLIALQRIDSGEAAFEYPRIHLSPRA